MEGSSLAEDSARVLPPSLAQRVHLSPLLVFLQEKILNHLSTLRRDRDKIQGFQAKGEADILAELVSEAVEGKPQAGTRPSSAGAPELVETQLGGTQRPGRGSPDWTGSWETQVLAQALPGWALWLWPAPSFGK